MNSVKARVLEMAKEDLADIETALEENLAPQLDLVARVSGHILFAGGKRLRPLLMVLCARLCGYDGEDVKSFSTIMEYLHAATLLHDDLVDEAVVRRGKPAAHCHFGNSTAVLVGDFLLARSLSIAADAGRIEILKIMADITENMSQGEIQQLMGKGRLDLTEDEYMEVIRRKTAVLIQGGCQVGAIFAHASPEEEQAIADYGLHLGMAFQMADDLLDYTADTAALGKAVGADLREGKMTLPLIYALKKAHGTDAGLMRHIIENRDFSDHDFNQLRCLIEKYGGDDYTRRKAAGHIASAKNALAVFNPCESKAVLLQVAEFVLSRKS
jgi:octaprenyl-diphosphate synthase